MFIRTPSQQPLANSKTKLAILLRGSTGSRVIEIGDRSIAIIVILTAILLVWYLFATMYLVFRDDLVVSLISGQRRNHYAYEDRIAELRSRIDKITAKQVINQDTIEDRVAGIIARQAELEARQIMVADLGNRAKQLGIGVTSSPLPGSPLPESMIATPEPDNTGSISSFAAPNAKPRPMPADLPMVAPRPLPEIKKGFDDVKMRGTLPGIVSQIDQRTKSVEHAQVTLLQEIENQAQRKLLESQRLIAAVGLPISRFGKAPMADQPMAAMKPALPQNWTLRAVDTHKGAESAMGGPLLPVTANDASSSLFDTHVDGTERMILRAGHLIKATQSLPLGRPMSTQHEITSSFGTRVDPFTRGYAMHSGIDFRAPTGTSVRAAAKGRIIEAGVSGGYGRMVEIDHGHGISTRYAHLSGISVREGDVVKKGDLIGQVGSTGRSTGPHLHYEIRIDDDATDPMRFVRARTLVADLP